MTDDTRAAVAKATKYMRQLEQARGNPPDIDHVGMARVCRALISLAARLERGEQMAEKAIAAPARDEQDIAPAKESTFRPGHALHASTGGETP